ncbi:MAG: L,D-transpeptidase family protein, partial [Pseudomonadota bacterium]
ARLVWWRNGREPAQVASIVDALAAAIHKHGLVADDYPFSSFAALREKRRWSTEDKAQIDVLLTLSVARFAQQVRYGRLEPRVVNEIMDYPVRTGDLARSVRFVAAGTASDRLLGLAPSQSGYRELLERLGQARAEAERGGWDQVEPGSLLRPGDLDDRVPALRRRLAVTDGYGFRPHGDLQSPVYDERLEAAVRRFQARHGLDVDGLIGGMTQRAFAISAQDRVRQIAMNLERWRWLPAYLGHDHFLVNIPDYHVEIVEEGTLAHRMPVVVGKVDRKTPIFSSRLTWLEVNPTWTVPERIAELDLLPKAIDDPNYFIDRKIRMYSSWREGAPQISTRYINWENMGERIRYHRLRQDPGPTNPLGRVKFMMANNFAIYLHDSNEPHLFDKSIRHLSSGCVRVADPRWLTGYLIDRPEVWSSGQEEDLFGDWETKRVSLKRPMPIHLAYFTSWTGADGAAHYRDDIYGFDSQMAEAWDQLRRQPISLASLP